jgi:DNA-binding CsgD family transcriptional regulator
MTSQRDLEIVDLRASGLTLAAIGDRFGLTRERVRQILYGPTLPKDTARNAAIIERRRQGVTCAQIGREFGLTQSAIFPICRSVPRAEVWRVRKSRDQKKFARESIRFQLKRSINEIKAAYSFADIKFEAELDCVLEAVSAVLKEMKLENDD